MSDNCEIIAGVFALVESSVLLNSNLATFLLTIWVSGSNPAHNPTESVVSRLLMADSFSLFGHTLEGSVQL